MRELQVKNKIVDKGSFFISKFKERIKKTKPHKHDLYYEVIILLSGEGIHSIEEREFIVTSPEFYFLKPGQLHHWQFTSIPRGYVILIREEEFNELYESHMISLLHDISRMQQIRLESVLILNQVELLYQEFQHQDQLSKGIIHSYLYIIFSLILREAKLNKESILSVNTLFQRFEELLLEKCPQLHRVKDYADILHTTPQNLNIICRREANLSASEMINNRIVIEAKRYLLHTDYSVDEIADILSFSATSNFIAYFKKHTNKTPSVYRREMEVL